jgi:alpha-mannosidase
LINPGDRATPAVVWCLPTGTPNILSSIEIPFVVEGTPNVFLETVKRLGELYDSFEEVVNLANEKFTTTSVILRLYEAYGGHSHEYSQARLPVSRHLPVLKAFTTNILEDKDEELYVLLSS